MACSVCLLRLGVSFSPLHIHHSSAQSAMKQFPRQSLLSTPEACKLLKSSVAETRTSRHSTCTISLPIGIAYSLIHQGKKTPQHQKVVSYSSPAVSSPQCYLHLVFHKIFLPSSDCSLEDQHKHHKKQQKLFHPKCR